jgi:hypothetical protein
MPCSYAAGSTFCVRFSPRMRSLLRTFRPPTTRRIVSSACPSIGTSSSALSILRMTTEDLIRSALLTLRSPRVTPPCFLLPRTAIEGNIRMLFEQLTIRIAHQRYRLIARDEFNFVCLRNTWNRFYAFNKPSLE